MACTEKRLFVHPQKTRLSAKTLIDPFSVPTNLVFVGASKDPSVVLANVDVDALCKIVNASGETTM